MYLKVHLRWFEASEIPDKQEFRHFRMSFIHIKVRLDVEDNVSK